MHLIDLSEEEADHALLLLTQHTPRDVAVGQPLIARRDDDHVMFVMPEEFWFVTETRAARLRPAQTGELTDYAAGRQLDRITGAN